MLAIFSVACDLLDVGVGWFYPISACAVILSWFRLFYFLRIFYATAALVRMIVEITYDMRYFIVILLMAVLAFANGFFILSRNEQENGFIDNWFYKAFIFSYRLGLGDFDTEGFEGRSDEMLIWVLWFVNTIIILIVLLNLLIAIMGDTFDRVQETAENSMLKELTQIMRENEFLINRKKLFTKAKYIIVVSNETAEETQHSWEGRLNYLRNFIEDSSRVQISVSYTLHVSLLGVDLEEAGEEPRAGYNAQG